MNTFLIIALLFVSAYSQTIVEIAVADGRFTALVQALTDTGLDTVLSGAGPFTVFAPTDDAFSQITVPSNLTVLSKVLQYHVLDTSLGEVLSTGLSSGLVAPTLIPQTITCQIDDPDVFFYDSFGRVSQVIQADVQGTNGVIHVIDNVLLPDGTLTDVVSNIPSLSDLTDALIANSLDTVLADPAIEYTVFAPTNDAIGAFSGTIDPTLLLYHVLPAIFLSDNIPDGATVITTANTADDVTVIKDDTGVYVKDAVGRIATVTMANFATTNGVVHVIDIVLAPTEFGTIVDLAVEDPRLTALVDALVAEGLDTALSGAGPYTVFAPTNDAIAAFGNSITSELLLYHVLGAEFLSANIPDGSTTLATINSDMSNVIVTKDVNGVTVTDLVGRVATVTQADIQGTNGVIHIIDIVLEYRDIVGLASDEDTLSDLVTALAGADADLVGTLQGPGPFTVFAPTNAAILAFTKVITDEVLLYHVLSGSEFLSGAIPDGNTSLATANTDGDEVIVMKNANGVFVKDRLGRVAEVTRADIQGTNGVIHIIDIVLEYRDIVDLAIDSGFSVLAGALVTTGLDSVLRQDGPFTVFAPTDDAFSQITVPENETVLAQVLTYHVLDGEVLSGDLSPGQVADTVNGESITVQIDNGVFIYDSMGMDAEVTATDIEASNGVIHVIDAVLLPGGTVVDVVSNIDSLSGLAGALTNADADLISILQGEGPFTIFAPTNAAIDAFTGTIDDQLLLYHVLSGAKLLSDDISDGETVVATANTAMDEVTVNKDATTGAVTVEDVDGRIATVTMANFAATNGVVHIIDIVLSPVELMTTSTTEALGTIVDIAVADGRFTTLVQALTDTGLDTVLSGAGPFTVFAPTDDAFTQITVPDNETVLSKVLQYHVLDLSLGEVLSTALSSGLVAPTLIGETITCQIDNPDVFFYDSMGRASQVIQADVQGTNGVIHVIDNVLLPGGTVVDVVSNIESLSGLAGALTNADADLIGVLSGEGPFTVFAPTNDAIDAFAGTIDDQLLLYHVLADAKLLSTDIADGETVVLTANGEESVTVIKDATTGAVTVEDVDGRIATVTMANYAATNGVVHIIDIVLSPVELPGTIVDIAVADGRFTTLVQALTDTGLDTVLSGDGTFTVFAPTDDAFAAIADMIPTNLTILAKVLSYHVLDLELGEVPASALTSGLVAPTLIEQTITCQLDDPDVFFYDSNGRIAQVIQADIQASNGIIHVIDSVFLPDGTLADITSNIESLSALNGALADNGLDTVLGDEGTYTLFAPTNDAVTAFRGTIDDQVLLYHVLGSVFFSGDIPDGETVVATANTDMDEVTVIKDATTGAVSVRDVDGRVADVTIANIAGTNGVAHIIDIVLSPDELPSTTEMGSTDMGSTEDANESGVIRVSISSVFCITFYFLAFLIFV